MKCKDIPEFPILEFLSGPYDGWQAAGWGTWFGNQFPNSVTKAMPSGIPEKLVLAKMRQMIRKGTVDGCACGCRGDFRITEKGRALLAVEQCPGESDG